MKLATIGAIGPEILGTMIPIVAIVMGFGFGMLGVYLNYRKQKGIYALYHQERLAAIEKGVELPPLPEHLFSEGDKTASPRRLLLKGLVWLFIGLGLLAALYAIEGHVALFALIPTGIGLAYLIYYRVAGQQEAELFEAAQKAKLAETGRSGSVL
ncbi:MAG: hypothetical protein FJ387_06535 [Verrucomicrobia bacterium]|nr:hypothetical protein [Verrucomicrobiota bacterium]